MLDRPTIGPYLIDGELGAGGMGVVYRAHHAGSAVAVALKVLTPGHDAPTAEARFRREIEIARTLDHPGIVRVLDAGRDGDRLYCVQELVEGRALDAEQVAEEWDWRRVTTALRDVADALAHAHAHGVIHRDVKPGNILAGADGALHLTDFGLAKAATRANGLSPSVTKLTTTGEVIGTPHYMSPEQARGVHALTPATDVWSLGCVGYEFLVGRPAYQGSTAAAVIGQVITSRPPPLARVAPHTPPGLQRIIATCLAHDLAERYPSGAELRDDCDRLLRGERPRGIPRRRRVGAMLAAAGLAVAAVAALGLTAARWWPRAPAPPVTPAGPAPDAEAARVWDRRAADPAAAADALRAILARAPALHDRRVQYGLLCWWIGRTADARAAWRAVPPATAAGRRARLYLGLAELFALDWPAARATLATGVPTDAAEGRLAAGALAIVEGRWDAASQALAGQPGWAAALLRAYVATAGPHPDHAAAVRDADRALAGGVPVIWALTVRSRAHQELGDLDAALADAEAACARAPSDAQHVYNRAVVRAARGERAQALADCDAALALAPDFAPALGKRGDLRRAAGDLPGALADHERLVALTPDDATAFVSLGDTHSARRDRAGALAAYDAAVALDGASVTARINRAGERLDAGDLAGALADFDVAVTGRPNDPEVWYGRGNVRHRLGDRPGARADYDAALARDPMHPSALYNRAVWHLQGGDGPAALADLDALLAADPGAADAVALRAKVVAAMRGR